MSGILFLADLHAGMTTHDGPDADGSPSWRANECRRVVRAAVDAANGSGAHIVMPGDVFHTRRPPAWAYLAVGEELSRANREVYAVSGNHDSHTGGQTPLGVLAAYGVNVVTRPVEVELGGYRLLMLPWSSRAWIAGPDRGMPVAGQHEEMAESIRVLVGEFTARDPGGPQVVVTHFTIAGAAYNSGTQPSLGNSGEFMVPLPYIAYPQLDYVISGHIHKPQRMDQGGCPVVYVGSAARHDFGEEEQVCSALYMAPGPGLAYIPLPAAAFQTYGLDGEITVDPAGKVVRVRGEAPAGPETAALIGRMHKRLEDAGALRIGKPAVTYTRHEAPKRSALSVSMTPSGALATYCDEVGGEYGKRKTALLHMHKEVSS